MKLKLICLGLAALGTASAALADGSQSTQIQVQGKIVPAACSISSNLPGNMVKFSDVPYSTLNATTSTKIKQDTAYALTINCASARAVTWTAADANVAGGVPPSVGTELSSNFGLGRYEGKDGNSHAIGEWQAVLNGSTVSYVDQNGQQKTDGKMIDTADGTTWYAMPGSRPFISTSNGHYKGSSIAASNDLTKPVAFKQATIDVGSTQVNLGSQKDLPLPADGGPIPFNGLATLELHYQ